MVNKQGQMGLASRTETNEEPMLNDPYLVNVRRVFTFAAFAVI